jgi:transketolase
MRRQFIESLVSLAQRDERVVLLTGDLGFAALEPFAETFPDRFFNAGVAEQNMIGMTTGLAEAGFTPYAYSISTFAAMRGFEFFRNGAILHDLPVRVVGMGEGVDYSHNGMTHYALEDIALMRAQPGLTIVSPASTGQVAPMLEAVQDVPGPAYIRLSKVPATVAGLPDEFELGRAHRIGTGDEVVLVALGAIAGSAQMCVDGLVKRGVQASVLVVSSVAPPPTEDLLYALSRAKFAVSVEAHYVTGGLGSLLAEVIAENGLACRLVRAGVHIAPLGVSGSVDYMHDQLGITPDRLMTTVLDLLTVASPLAVR